MNRRKILLIEDNFTTLDMKKLKAQLKIFVKNKNIKGLTEYLEQNISSLSFEPRFNCMIRHVLESMNRITHLAPIHDKNARAKGLKSTMKLSMKLLKLHLMLLNSSADLDKKAAQIQSRGIPIICQDVPPITVF